MLTNRQRRTILATVLTAGTLFAQPPRQAALEDAMRKSGLRLQPVTERARASHEIRIRLLAAPTSPARVSAQLVQRTPRTGPPPRQRSAEMSADHLLVLVLDAAHTVRYWQIVIDPRLIRGEFPDAAGNLRKTETRRADAELNVAIPDVADAAEIRIFTPGWPAGELVLTPLASLDLTQGIRQ